jgi:serine/threonine protein kinase
VEEHNGHAFPEADVRRVKRQLKTGAAAMHERDIIHRDIKPTNILVDSNDSGIIKLCPLPLLQLNNIHKQMQSYLSVSQEK